MSTQFYRPYSSDTETESETESDTDTVQSYTNTTANFVNLANNLLTPSIGGPSITDISNTVFFQRNKNLNYSLLNPPPSSNANLFIANTNAPTVHQETSIINLDSINRDKQVYPQPTNIQLRLPRIYKNILNFNIVQIKLLSSFLYFRTSKKNTTIAINEQARYLDISNTILNNIITTIREGTYNINSLLTEINTQLNIVPLFYDYINGFTDFVPLFASTGDLFLGFNTPGDYYYDSVLDEYISNPTVDQILTKYFQTRYASQTSYSINNIKIAYYYPVLKEILFDNIYIGKEIDFSTANSTLLLPTETPLTRCAYSFQGLNDAYVLSVIQSNITTLDTYRLNHTFRYSLVNKYVAFYDTNNNNISISAVSLNTSLVNLLNNKQTQYFNEQLTYYDLSGGGYSNLFTQNSLYLAILTDMYNYLQVYFATNFGIQYNTYSLSYFGSMENYVSLRNGSNAIVSSNYDINVIINDTPPQSNNIVLDYKTNPPYYWQGLQSNARSNYASGTNYSNYTGNPFNLQADIPEEYHKLINTTSRDIYSSRLINHVDAVVDINNTSYTIFKFKSSYRQTLQVETLPRPTKYRNSEYNAITYDLSYVNLFDNSYNFIYNQSNIALKDDTIQVSYIPGFTALSDSNFSISLPSSIALWSSNASITSANNRNFFTLIPPLPSTTNIAYRYSLKISVSSYPLGTTFANPFNVFIYKDVGAFYADVSSNRTESIYNYFTSNLITTTDTIIDIPVETYQTTTTTQQFYIITRSELTSPTTINYIITPWFETSSYIALSNTLSNFTPYQQNSNNFLYSRSYDTNYLNLPSIPVSNNFPTDLSYNSIPMGYDLSGVSTDLTHYIGYVKDIPNTTNIPNSQFRVDPISQYIFKVGNGYNSTLQTYINSNTTNKIFTSQLLSNYIPQIPLQRSYTQAHYSTDYYIPNSRNQSNIPSDYISDYSIPFSQTSFSNTLSGYNFDTTGILQLGDGVYGISLIPGEGTWDIQRYMFRSIFINNSWNNVGPTYYNSDPNLTIKYLGVFYTNTIQHLQLSNIYLKDSIATLTFSKSVIYNSSNTDSGFGLEGGTYYEFTRDTSFRTGKYSYLYGFTESANTITTDINNGYTIIGFTSSSNVVPFIGLTGSLVPYPYYSDAVASNAYLDGTIPPMSASVIIPQTKTLPNKSFGIPKTESQSSYEESMPIGTTYLAYANSSYSSSNIIFSWSNISTICDKIIMDISGYMLTQGNDYRLYSYSMTSDVREFSLITTLTADAIFPINSNISIVGISANGNEYAFLAFSNVPGAHPPVISNVPSIDKLLITTLNPNSLVVQSKLVTDLLIYPANTLEVQSFTYNNLGGFTLGISYTDSNSSNYKYAWGTSNTPTSLSSYTVVSNVYANTEQLQTYQSPKEKLGNFYVSLGTTSKIVEYSFIEASIPYANSLLKHLTASCKITSFFNPYAGFDKLVLVRAPVQDVLFSFSLSAPTYFNQISYTTSTDSSCDSNMSFTASPVLPNTMVEFEGGYNGGLWFRSITGLIYGNRNTSLDNRLGLSFAWQIFYPTQRVIYTNISKKVDTMLDLSGIDEYSEYYHTQLFFYNDLNSFITDISGSSTIAPWGNESNFYISDTHFSGYEFNALTTIPLLPSSNEYILAVRNYSPTEKSQVYMRFSLPNRNDFGLARFIDISNEVQNSLLYPSSYNPNYTQQLQSFNSNFIFTSKIFGSNIVPGFYGITLSNLLGYGDFMKSYNLYYGLYQSNATTISNITNSVNSNMSNFITNDLKYIIPASAVNRQRFTDPLLFSILWNTNLTSQYRALSDEWGLGWNLGYAKQDTSYATIHRASSFFKILDDHIYLQLNQEFNFNKVDITGKEDISSTLESTGITRAYYGKLLLTPFGSYAQTMIMNPITFNPPLGKLDKLSFTWYDNAKNIINNADCEWSVVIQIVENVIDVIPAGFAGIVEPK